MEKRGKGSCKFLLTEVRKGKFTVMDEKRTNKAENSEEYSQNSRCANRSRLRHRKRIKLYLKGT